MSGLSLRDALPPALTSWLKRHSPWSTRFEGDYSAWSRAASDAGGYDSDEILAKLVDATEQVVAGKAAYERDSVLFGTPRPPFAVLTGLLRARRADGSLTVLDVGGALGGIYRQCRALLGPVRWMVLEQPKFADLGRERFQTDELTFHGDLQDLLASAAPDVVLCSSVLQYIEHARDLLLGTLAPSVRSIVIDRTPMALADDGTIVVQRVSPRIYNASYAMRIFPRDAFQEWLGDGWTRAADFPCDEGVAHTRSGRPFEFRGFIFDRKS